MEKISGRKLFCVIDIMMQFMSVKWELNQTPLPYFSFNYGSQKHTFWEFIFLLFLDTFSFQLRNQKKNPKKISSHRICSLFKKNKATRSHQPIFGWERVGCPRSSYRNARATGLAFVASTRKALMDRAEGTVKGRTPGRTKTVVKGKKTT